MPGRNRTGPMGQGPQTGRCAGRCAGYGMADCGNNTGFRRFGGGAWHGWGNRMRGRRYAFGMDDATPIVDSNEFQSNETQADCLENRLDKIEKRLDEMASKTTG